MGQCKGTILKENIFKIVFSVTNGAVGTLKPYFQPLVRLDE